MKILPIPTISEQAVTQPRKCYAELQNLSEMDEDFTSLQETMQEFQASASLANINKENNNCTVNSDTPSSWHIQNKRTINSTERVQRLRKEKKAKFIRKREQQNMHHRDTGKDA